MYRLPQSQLKEYVCHMSAQSHGGCSLDLNLALGDHKVATTLEHVTLSITVLMNIFTFPNSLKSNLQKTLNLAFT